MKFSRPEDEMLGENFRSYPKLSQPVFGQICLKIQKYACIAAKAGTVIWLINLISYTWYPL